MQHRQQQWQPCNNNQSSERKFHVSENGRDQRRGRHEDNQQPGLSDFSRNGNDQRSRRFEERRRINRTPSPYFNKSYDGYEQWRARRSPSPSDSYGANFEERQNHYQNDYEPRRFEPRNGKNRSPSPRYDHGYDERNSRKSPSPCFQRNNGYDQRRQNYSPRRSPSPYNNCQRHSDNRRFNCSTSRNRSSSPHCNQCNNWRRNDYSPRRSPSPRTSYHKQCHHGRFNCANSRNRSPSPLYNQCRNETRSIYSPRRLRVDYEHHDEQMRFECYQSSGPNLNQNERYNQRRSPSPYRNIDKGFNQNNFRRWRSPNRSSSSYGDRFEMERQQDDSRCTEPNVNYDQFEYQKAFIRTRDWSMEFHQPKSPVNNGLKNFIEKPTKVSCEKPINTGDLVVPNLDELREIMRPPPLLYSMPLAFWGTGFRTKDYVEALKNTPDYKYPHYSKDRKWTEGIVLPSNETSFLWET